jgi:hypothetical protein
VQDPDAPVSGCDGFLECAGDTTICLMPARDDQFGLRLAAKAADRAKAAGQQWPAFEQRLRELGYAPRSIAHAFSVLSGPGTVAEALDALERAES